jgi:hypothetical protein
MEQICDLFQDNSRLASLLLGFSAFLPEEYHAKLTSAGTLDMLERQVWQSSGSDSSDCTNQMNADEDIQEAVTAAKNTALLANLQELMLEGMMTCGLEMDIKV